MLQDIGIDLIGHRIKIWAEIKKLNALQADNNKITVGSIQNDEFIIEGDEDTETLH